MAKKDTPTKPSRIVFVLLDVVQGTLKTASSMVPSSDTLICSFITSPHAGAPTSPACAACGTSVVGSPLQRWGAAAGGPCGIMPAERERKGSYDRGRGAPVPTFLEFLSRAPTFLGLS